MILISAWNCSSWLFNAGCDLNFWPYFSWKIKLKHQFSNEAYQSYLAKEPSIQFWSFASNDTEPISGQNLPFEKNGLKSKKKKIKINVCSQNFPKQLLLPLKPKFDAWMEFVLKHLLLIESCAVQLSAGLLKNCVSKAWK